MGTDYKLLGIYKADKNIENNTKFVKSEDAVYEISEFSIEKQPILVGNFLCCNGFQIVIKRSPIKTVLYKTLIFVCYKRLLCIYNSANGKLIKELPSTEDIFAGSHGFMLFDKVNFIVNLMGECIFTNKPDNVLEFTAEGLVFFRQDLIPETKQSNQEVTKDLPAESVVLSSSSKSSENIYKLDSHFSVQSLKSKKTYDSNGEILYQDERYTVYRNSAEIKSPISCNSIKIGKVADKIALDLSPSFMSVSTTTNTVDQKNVIFVACKHEVFVIFEDYVVKKQVDKTYNFIIPERLVFHNYINEEDVYWCLLFVNCFESTVLYKAEGIEDFLFALANKPSSESLLDKFLLSLKWNAMTYGKCDFNKIVCKLYRVVDEPKRVLVEKWIDYENINADQLYYMIIYKLDMVDRFIDLCINEKRLFYLVELKEFYYKIDRADDLKRKLLSKGLLIFEYIGLEHFYSLEKDMIESQRRTYISRVKFYDSLTTNN